MMVIAAILLILGFYLLIKGTLMVMRAKKDKPMA